MKCIRIAVLCAAMAFTLGVDAQTLSKTDAVRLVLEQNYDVQRAANNIEIARNNTDRGAVGYNPVVNATGNASLDYGNAFSSFQNGNEIEAKGAVSTSGNASVFLDYNIYEGNRRDLTMDQLLETVSLTQLQQRQQIETSLLEMLLAYYQVANLSNTVSALEETQRVTRRRRDRAQYQFEYGQGNRLLVLNAEVDLNRDSINLSDARQQLENAKRDVNVLLGRDVDIDFDVDTLLSYDRNLDIENLVREGLDTNVQVLLARKDLVLFDYDRQLIETTARPTIGLTGSLGGSISKQITGPSFIDFQTRWGPSVGVGVAWNIWDGGVRRVQRENVRIAMENQELAIEQIGVQLERDIRNAWGVYQNSLRVLDIETYNLATNRDNFTRTQEQFNVGQVTSVQFRQAQFDLVNAAINLSTARYTAKVAELRLLQLCGKLLDAEF